MTLIKSLLRLVLGVVLVGFGIALAFLLEAHLEMRGLERPLPESQSLLEFGRAAAASRQGPIHVRYVESGRQSRGSEAHSTTGGFVLEWADGRRFAIDLGMSRPAMQRFGRGLELMMGAGEVEVFGSLAEQLGPGVAGVASGAGVEGVGFTHLHTDHTEGAIEFCAARAGSKVLAYQTQDQFERQNYTTSMGRDELEAAGCIEPRMLEGPRPLLEVPGFPGLAAFAAGGHTPGSTVWVARLPTRLMIFAGDITNVHAHLAENRPKGFVYSYLMIPESTVRLEVLRRWLATVHAPPHVEVVVSHDLEAIEASGIPVGPGRRAEIR